MNVLVTGGCGFIGSHTCVALLDAGHSVVILDNLSNSSSEAARCLQQLAHRPVLFIEGDVRNRAQLDSLFSEFDIDAVCHFAGLKAVGESVSDPLRYWDVNVAGTSNLLSAMDAHGVRTFVFSSSATVYGTPVSVPICEQAPVRPVNPYGETKAAVERMLSGLDGWRVASLRYFNPVGAHPSGLIGEDPLGTPQNLFPYVAQVAVGRREHLFVFGDDYGTSDGTCVRDYIHVMDLAEGHVKAVEFLSDSEPNSWTINLGSGRGHSVLEVVEAFSSATGSPIPYQVASRRSGDVAQSVADPTLARDLLGWQTVRTLQDMCRDSWAWQSTNPYGYHQ